MSYENTPIRMSAENVGSNVQKIHLGCCNCRKDIEQLRRETAVVRQIQDENKQLLLAIREALIGGSQEPIKG